MRCVKCSFECTAGEVLASATTSELHWIYKIMGKVSHSLKGHNRNILMKIFKFMNFESLKIL